jgi:hypothetical protein
VIRGYSGTTHIFVLSLARKTRFSWTTRPKFDDDSKFTVHHFSSFLLISDMWRFPKIWLPPNQTGFSDFILFI